MKNGWMIVVVMCMAVTVFSCKAKYGCPSNGRNAGAEKLLSGDKKSMKEIKKAGKFKLGKIPSER